MREKRYKWVVIASYDQGAYRRGDMISKHTTYELAHAALKRSGYETMREIRNVDEIETGEAELSIAASTLGRKGGASKSEAKVQAARDNGKKGGRPKTARKG